MAYVDISVEAMSCLTRLLATQSPKSKVATWDLLVDGRQA